MSGPGSEPETTGPKAPAVPWDPDARVGLLGEWIGDQHGSFTEEALERAAIKAGYTHDEFVDALGVLQTRSSDRARIGPIRTKARWIILAAYGLVWLIFAIPYLGSTSTSYSYGPGLQTILTIALAIGLAISLIVIQLGRPDPGRADRAVTILLVLPVVLLLGVAGSCLPFVGLA